MPPSFPLADLHTSSLLELSNIVDTLANNKSPYRMEPQTKKSRIQVPNEPNKNEKIDSRQRRKLAYRARHRLHSIGRDAQSLKQRVLSTLSLDDLCSNIWPWIPNKQCGSWYLPPPTALSSPSSSPTCSCYFKSTDGHVGTYNISLKRLNLPLIEFLNQHGGCYLVDSSVRKVLPDSFSRTIPIWACVMNRIVQLYRHEFGMVDGEKNSSDKWDTHLYTPSSIISSEEHTVISNLIDSRVEVLYQSKAIVDPKRLVQIMTKPVRAIWVSNDMIHQDTIFSSPKERLDKVSFSIIACCNPSLYLSNTKNHIQWMQHHVHSSDEEIGYYYTPGAADDDATWARRLTHELFWKHKDQILNPSLSEDATDTLIDSLVEQHQIQHDNGQIVEDNSSNDQTMDQIGSMNLWIGSRRAGRPPECWNNFEAILNVTENEYPNMQQSIAEQTQQTCYYLQLPVAEGKRDKTELERWMPIGLVFIIQHLQRGRRVLVHCAQGKDRSVAMVLALVAIACPLTYPLKLHDKFQGWNVASIVPDTNKSNEKGKLCYLQSGLLKYLTDALLRENGSDIFLQWIHNNQDIPMDKTLATKESIRITLHLVGQDREVAHPTRSSMQKLNRFFMSGSRYRS